MNKDCRPFWSNIALAMTFLAINLAGCCRHRPELEPNPCGGACQPPIYWEHPFYGYNPTCWQPWPAGWVGCPPVCAVPGGLEAPVGAESVPPGVLPPGAPSPVEMELTPPSAPAPAALEGRIPSSSRFRTGSRQAALTPEAIQRAADGSLSAMDKSTDEPKDTAKSGTEVPPAGITDPPVRLRYVPARTTRRMHAPDSPPSLSEILSSGPATLSEPRIPLNQQAEASIPAVSRETQRPLIVPASTATHAQGTVVIPVVALMPQPATRTPRRQEVTPLRTERAAIAPRSLSDILATDRAPRLR